MKNLVFLDTIAKGECKLFWLFFRSINLYGELI